MRRILPYCLVLLVSCTERKAVDKDKVADVDKMDSIAPSRLIKAYMQSASRLYAGVKLLVTDSVAWDSIMRLPDETLSETRRNEIELYPAGRLVRSRAESIVLEYFHTTSFPNAADAFYSRYVYISIPDQQRIVTNRDYDLPHRDIQVQTWYFKAIIGYEEYKVSAGKINFTTLNRDSAHARILVVSETPLYTHLKAIGEVSSYMKNTEKKPPLLDTLLSGEFSFLLKGPVK